MTLGVDWLWSSPFTDDAPGGPDDVFEPVQVEVLVDKICHLNATAEVPAAS